MGKPILFFFVDSDFCKRYYQGYIKKYVQNVRMIEMANATNEDKALAKLHNVVSVPTVVILDEYCTKAIMSWHGGRTPDMHKVGIELLMRKEF